MLCDLGAVQENDGSTNPWEPVGVLGADDDFSKSDNLQDSEQYVAPSVCLSQAKQNWCSQDRSDDIVNGETVVCIAECYVGVIRVEVRLSRFDVRTSTSKRLRFYNRYDADTSRFCLPIKSVLDTDGRPRL